ncbi:hypothetical protein Tco_0026956 [Tanacetum coccineum]
MVDNITVQANEVVATCIAIVILIPCLTDRDQMYTKEWQLKIRCMFSYLRLTVSVVVPVAEESDNGRTFKKQGADLDGGFVVPNNPTLLKRYHAHVNVEWCNQFEGPDRVTAAVEDEETDEIKDCRCIKSLNK